MRSSTWIMVVCLWMVACNENLYNLSKEVATDPGEEYPIEVYDVDFEDATPPDAAPTMIIDPVSEVTPPDAAPPVDATGDARPSPDAAVLAPENSHTLSFSWEYTGYNLAPEIGSLGLSMQCTDEWGGFRLYEATEPVPRITPHEDLEVFNIWIVAQGVKESWQCYVLLVENDAQARLTLPKGTGYASFDENEQSLVHLYEEPGPFLYTWGPLQWAPLEPNEP